MGLLARALRRVRPWTLLLAVVPAFLLSGCFGPEAPAAPAAGAVRGEKDKTPFPCKESYTDDEIKSFVDTHLRDAKGGHSEPQLLLMLGGSGAGKGTFIDKWTSAERQSKAPAHPLSGFVFHGLDEYLPYIPEYVKSVNDKAFVYKDAADACYKPAAIPAAKLAGDRIVNNRLDLIYEETGKSMDRIVKRVLPPFTKAGYRITTVLVHNKPEIAIGRAAGRFQKTGRYAADDYINGTFANNLETYMGLQKVDGLSEFVYCDNSAKEIRCWQDRAVGGKLVPSSVLLNGPPVYMGSKPQAKPAAKPAAKEPAAKKPAAKKPAAKEPAAKEPAAKKPAAKEPAAKQPAAKKPAAKEPAAKQPAAKKPAAKEPAAKEPAAKKPAAKKPAAKEPPAKKPAAKEPAAKKPAAKKPAAKEPAAKPAAGKGRGAEL